MGGFSNDAKHDIVYVVFSFCWRMFGMWRWRRWRWWYGVYLPRYQLWWYDMLTVLCQPHCHHLQPTSNCRQSATKYTSRAQAWPSPGGRLILNNFHTENLRDDVALWLLWSNLYPEVENKFWSHSRAEENLHKISLSGQGGWRSWIAPESTEILRQNSR